MISKHFLYFTLNSFNSFTYFLNRSQSASNRSLNDNTFLIASSQSKYVSSLYCNISLIKSFKSFDNSIGWYNSLMLSNIIFKLSYCSLYITFNIVITSSNLCASIFNFSSFISAMKLSLCNALFSFTMPFNFTNSSSKYFCS